METGVQPVRGNTGEAWIGHADMDMQVVKNKLVYQACRLDNERVEDLLQELEDKALITKNKHSRCFAVTDRAVPVTFKDNK